MTVTCSVEECGKPIKRAGLCYAHYMRQYRYGSPTHRPEQPHADLTGQRFGQLVAKEYLKRDSTRTVSMWLCQCDCGRTSTVRTGDLRRGTVRTCGAIAHQLEEAIEYTAAHDRVVRAKGRAAEHDCVDCGRTAAHWSYDHQDPGELHSATVKGSPPFSLNPDHYQPRCVPCHKVYDLTVAA